MLYHSLADDEQGKQFLLNDRKGFLITEITREIDILLLSSQSSRVPQLTNSMNSNWYTSISKCVFKPSNCSHSMTRELFTLVGSIISTPTGNDLLDGTSLFRTLSLIGSKRQLDYLSRITLATLSFTDGGFLSQHLMKVWSAPTTSSGNAITNVGKNNINLSGMQTICSSEVILFMHVVMKALFRSRPATFLKWGIDVLLRQITAISGSSPSNQSIQAGGGMKTNNSDNKVNSEGKNRIENTNSSNMYNSKERVQCMESLLQLVTEIVEDKNYLRLLLRKITPLQLKYMVSSEKLLTRMLSIPEGVELLEKWQWIDIALSTVSLTAVALNESSDYYYDGNNSISNSRKNSISARRNSIDKTTVINLGADSVENKLVDELVNAVNNNTRRPSVVNRLEKMEAAALSALEEEEDSHDNSSIISGAVVYANKVENNLALALSSGYTFRGSTATDILQPICIPVRDIATGLPPISATLQSFWNVNNYPTDVLLKEKSSSSNLIGKNFSNDISPSFNTSQYPPPPPVLYDIDALSAPSTHQPHVSIPASLQPALGFESNATECIDLEGLIRIPWNIEVKIHPSITPIQTSHNSSHSSINSNSSTPPSKVTNGNYLKATVDSFESPMSSTEYLKLDCFLGKYVWLVSTYC